MRHFQFDPFVHRPREKSTVAALRAEATDVDLSVRVGGGGKPPSAYQSGFVTVGDLQNQIATAFATPFDDSERQVVSEDAARAKAESWGRSERGSEVD